MAIVPDKNFITASKQRLHICKDVPEPVNISVKHQCNSMPVCLDMHELACIVNSSVKNKQLMCILTLYTVERRHFM